MKKLLIAAVLSGVVVALAASPSPIDFAARARSSYAGTVRRAEVHDRQMGVIELFTAAYHFCESGLHLDKLDVLFDVAAEMQDRDSESRGYGNYRWYYRDGFVMDYNAVDFCMQTGSIMARRHREKMTAAQRTKFEKLLELSIQGCLNHRVRPSYTNIAIMNAVNLILLGEACDRADAFAAGVERLDAFVLNTALFGVNEYSSPTYTAVDVANLHRLHANVRDARVKETCVRLLRLFWTDICASAFPGAGRLGGPHSRDYDYLHGMGGVAQLLRAAGVAPPLADVDRKGKRRAVKEQPPLEFALDDWRPDAATRALATRAGRFLESRWGDERERTRSYWAGRNVALGIAGANYWNMDIPLAVDFVSERRMARGYFIPDARRDPYGMKKIPEGSGPHQKTLHLRPFWGGAQRGRDALGLVVYRAADIPPETPTLESHFVFPSDADEIYIGDERIERPEQGKPFARPLAPSACVFVRQGGGAFGVRVPWARDLRGEPAKMALVWDGAPGVQACRFTVAHQDFWGCPVNPDCLPGASFWVRVCDEADDAAKFTAFRSVFAAAKSETRVEAEHVAVSVPGEEGRLVLAAGAPFASLETIEPAPRQVVLAVDGRDLGAEILGDVPGVAAYRAEIERARREMAANQVFVTDLRPVTWEAEKGAVVPNMAIGKDSGAFGGRYVWTPGEPGSRGSGSGTASWQLRVEKTGEYRLWGRVSTATPEDDSFLVSANAGDYSATERRGPQIFAPTPWHLGVTRGLWKWVPFLEPIKLSKGPVVLTLYVREDGAKIDRLFLSSDSSEDPQD
ncbi:MAG: hypothetical protein ACI4RA_01930 [Kiritimatiellia bacterium]